MDIESENLEAHVRLCAERYNNLNDKLEAVDKKFDKIEEALKEIKASVIRVSDRQRTTIEKIGGWIINGLIIALCSIAAHFVFK